MIFGHQRNPPAPPPQPPSLVDKLSSYLKWRPADARAVHSLALKLGCLGSTFLCNNLIHAYSSQSLLGDARKLFDETPQPNSVTWSTMISCYTQVGNLDHAVVLLRELSYGKFQDCRDGGVLLPNSFTLSSIITGCARQKDLQLGEQMHCSTIKLGFDYDTFMSSTLIDMYGKCRKLNDSWRVFEQTPNKDSVTWTTMITCLTNTSELKSLDAALNMFKGMICRGIWPVDKTFVSIIKLFDEPKKLCQAKQVHGCIVKLGTEIDDLLGSSLIAMYGRCSGLEEAVRLSARVTMDVVSWTSLLVAYMNNGHTLDAINVFRKMIEDKIIVDAFVITSVIGACSDLGVIRMGEEIYSYAIRNGFSSDVSVGNALITLYGRCNEIAKAERVFQLISYKDIISWTALLTCHAQNGNGEKAVLLLQEMIWEGISPPIYCISGAIRACSTIASLSMGQQIHSRSVKMGIDDHLSISNSLITMYARCGHIEVALRIFNFMTCRDIVSWNALITGFSQHGHERAALELFEQMQKEGIQPDDYTFTGVLVSCSRLGLVAQGCNYFQLMCIDHELEPKMEHYACIVDLFGRAGKLNDAIEFINAMPCQPDLLVWEALLASCKVHGNIELLKFAANKIMQTRSDDASPYITLSNIYASMGLWHRKAYVQAAMKVERVQKDPGKSWIEGQEWLENTPGTL